MSAAGQPRGSLPISFAAIRRADALRDSDGGVPVGGGAVFEVRLAEPGDYPFVSHAFADATKGAVGVLRAK